MQKISASTRLLAISLVNLGDLVSNLIKHGGATDEQANCIQDELTSMSSNAAMKKNGLWDEKKEDANNVNGWRSRKATIMNNFFLAMTQPARDITGFSSGRKGSTDPVVAQIIDIAKEANRKARKTLKLGTRRISFASMRGFNKEWTNQFKADLSALKKSGVDLPASVTDLCTEHLSLYPESYILAQEAGQSVQAAFREEHELSENTVVIPPRLSLAWNRKTKSAFGGELTKIRAKHDDITDSKGNVLTNADLCDKFLSLIDDAVARCQNAAHEAETKTRKAMDILTPKVRIHADIAEEYNKGVVGHFTDAVTKLRKTNPDLGTDAELIEEYLVTYEVPAAAKRTPKPTAKAAEVKVEAEETVEA